MADAVHVNAAALRRAGATVADSLDRAAQPAPVPVAAGGTSPADAAAAAVAAAMSGTVAAAAAELAPRGPQMRAASEAAATNLTAADEQNAATLQTVSAENFAGTAGSGIGGGGVAGRIEQVSDGWDEPAEPWRIGPDFWEDEFGHFHPPIEPIDPGGAAAGGGGAGRAPV